MIMSRRKQSNPKPLKREEEAEEEWKSDMSKMAVVDETEIATASNLEATNGDTLPKTSDQTDGDNQTSINIKVESPSPPISSPLTTTVTDAGESVDNFSDLPDGGNQKKTRPKSHLALDPAIILTLQQQQKHLSTILMKKESNDSAKINESLPLTLPTSAITSTPSGSTNHCQTENCSPETSKTLQQSQQPQIPHAPYFICNPCGIRFSSFSTLDAHQTYYCAFRKNPNTTEPEECDDKPKDNQDSEPKSQGPNRDKNSVRVTKQYVCNHCSYSADKRASLNRHMRMHSLSPNSSSSTIVNGNAVEMDPTIQADRYCTNCDIKFSSVKTFRAHKLHYCSGRHNSTNNHNNNNSNVNSNSGNSNQKDSNSTSESAPTSPVNEPFCPSPSTLIAPNPPVNIQQSFLALPTSPILIIPYNLLQNASLISGPSNYSNTDNPDSPCFLFPNGSIYPMTQAFSMALMSLQQHQQQQHLQHPPCAQQKAPSPDLPKKRPLGNEATSSTTSNKESPLDLSVKRLKTEQTSGVDESRTPSPEWLICTPSIMVGDQPSPSPKSKTELSNSSRSNSPKPVKENKSAIPLIIPSPFSAPFFLNNAMANPSVLTNEMAMKFLNEFQPQPTVNNNLTINNNVIKTPTVTPPLPLPLAQQPHPQQMVLKQGSSKCQECNIVFCKYENFIAHKKHYCSARITNSNSNLDEINTKTPSPSNCNSVTVVPISKSPNSSDKMGSQYQQIVCLACGIKFTTIDNLNAHQTYYCLKRKDLKSDPQNMPRMKCLKCKKIVDMVGHKCNFNEKQPQPQPQSSSSETLNSHQQTNGWKCPFCDEISVTASAAHRHMEVHSIVKAYRCTICLYKGNTLRGMRTHIRMHFDKKNTDIHEEKYVSYILDENASNPEVKIMAVPLTKSKTNDLDTQMLKTKSPESKQPPAADHKLYVCEMCNYSSNLKNSLLRHQKLLHSTKSKRLTNGVNENKDNDVAETNEIKTEEVEDNKDEDQNGEEQTIIKMEPIDGVKTGTESEMEIDVLNNEDDAKTNDISKFCKSCGISFNYFSTYLAHKKFYCSSHVNEQIVNNNNDNELSALSPTSAATGATPVTGTTAFLVEKS